MWGKVRSFGKQCSHSGFPPERGDVLVIQHDASGINSFQTCNQAKNGCFTAARRAKQREELAIVDSQIQLGNDLFTIKAFANSANCTSGESELGCLFNFYSVPCKRNGWLTDAGFVVNHLGDS